MSQSPYAGVPDDDDDDLGGGPAAGSGSPAAPPFSPTGATASEQMMLRMFQQMAEATKVPRASRVQLGTQMPTES